MPKGNRLKDPINLILKMVSLFFGTCLIISYFTPFINPTDCTMLPFFGLAFPVLLFINTVLFIVWLSKRDSWLWLPAVILVIGIPFQMKIFSVSIVTNEAPKGASQWKVMSYNVHLFDLYNPDFRAALKTRDLIFNFIRKEAPDVLCLQEYYKQKKPTKKKSSKKMENLIYQ